MGNHTAKPRTTKKPADEILEKLHKKVPNLTMEEIKSQWDIFQEHSKGKGRLKKENFVEVYTLVFGKDASEYAEHIFNAFDINGDGKVSFEEFLIGISLTDTNSTRTQEQRHKQLEFFFALYDGDRNGQIDREEMRGMVKAVYHLSITPEEQAVETPEQFADELFNLADTNNDGFVNFEEFENAVYLDKTLVDILLPCPRDEGTGE